MRVTIIGAGVVGLTCALELAERGVTVEIIDQSRQLGAQSSSWYAGGMLAPWCELESAEPLVARLGEQSIAWWRKHVPALSMSGSLVVARGRDVPELTRFARKSERFEWIDSQRIGELEPTLAGRFEKALWFADEAHLNPRDALGALHDKLCELGARFRFGVSEEELDTDADQVLDCRGLGAREVLSDLRGVKGEMLLVRTTEIDITRPVRMLHPRFPLYIVPHGEGLYMIGATMIESDEESRISARSMMELLNTAYALHPAFGEAEIVEIGTGVRPAFADNLPRIRRRNAAMHINGMYRHGFLLSPALAQMTADIILNDAFYPEVMDEDSRQR